jgi:hypothetical protein
MVYLEVHDLRVCTADEAGDELSMWYVTVLFGMEVLLLLPVGSRRR